MPKKKRKAFSAAKAVKAAARATIGAPPPGLAIPDKRRKKQAETKHKRSLALLVAEDQR
jgi:hypothetical protein